MNTAQKKVGRDCREGRVRGRLLGAGGEWRGAG